MKMTCTYNHPREFWERLKGLLPRPVKLKTNNWCAWFVHIKEHKGELVLDDGWFKFAEVHELKPEDVLVFKVKDDSWMEVEIFDSNTSTKRVIFCADHP